MKLLNEDVVSNKAVVALVGCGCSSASEEVSKSMANVSTLPVVSLLNVSVFMCTGSVHATYSKVLEVLQVHIEARMPQL